VRRRGERYTFTVGGWLAIAALACTGPNPAYRPSTTGDEGEVTGDPPAGGRDGGALRDSSGGPAASGGGLDGGAGAVRPAGCGSAQPALAGVRDIDSMAIDRDGVIYFNQGDTTNAWIDRLHPDGKRDTRWTPLPAGQPVRGLAIDGGRRILYVLAGMGPARLQAIAIDAADRSPRDVHTPWTDPNDITVGPDGRVFVTEQGDGHVYAVTPAGARTRITGTPIGDVAASTGPAGLAFHPDGSLMVGTRANTLLVKIRFDDQGQERLPRLSWGNVRDWANGLAVDDQGRVYVAIWNQDAAMPRSVVRLEGDGLTPTPVLTGGRFSAMAFGRGKLDCGDLYVAEPYNYLRRVPTGVRGYVSDGP
jgi:sugar lactone lactonase YvrE